MEVLLADAAGLCGRLSVLFVDSKTRGLLGWLYVGLDFLVLEDKDYTEEALEPKADHSPGQIRKELGQR